MALILAENIIYYCMENGLSMLPPKGVNHVFNNENPGDASSTSKLYLVFLRRDCFNLCCTQGQGSFLLNGVL